MKKSWYCIAVTLSILISDIVNAESKIVLGVHPYQSVEKLQNIYHPLTELLANKLKVKVSLNIAKDYKTHIDLIGQDKIDIAYVGPASYVTLVEKYGNKRLLARQIVNGKPTFTGNIIVRKDSAIHKISDLENKRVAFGDPESTMSHLVPRYMLIKNGITKDKLSKMSFLGSHDNVAIAVLSGEYDAGAVKEAVYHKYEADGVRSLATTPELSEHLFVASNKLAESTVKDIRNILFDLHNNEEGKKVLKSIKNTLTGMGAVEDKDYANLREILMSLKKINIINE